MHVNVPIFSLCDSGLTAEMEAAGLFSLLEKYETAASLRLPVALLLWTQIETAINLSEKKKSPYLKSCKRVRP